MKNINIEGEQVYLRYITYEDTDMIVRWRNQDNVKRYFFCRDEFTKESHENWLKTRVETGEVVQFVVCMKEDDRPIGCTYIRDIDYEDSKAEYGVFIGETNARGRGIGKEILELTVRYAFDELKLHRIYARVIEGNDASLNCFLRCSFTQEGLLRDTKRIEGEYINTVILGRLSDD